MFTEKSLMEQSEINQTIVASGKRSNARRTSKMLVQLSIGVLGIFGMMIASIGNENSQNSHQHSIVDVIGYEIGDALLGKVPNLAKVSPKEIESLR